MNKFFEAYIKTVNRTQTIDRLVIHIPFSCDKFKSVTVFRSSDDLVSVNEAEKTRDLNSTSMKLRFIPERILNVSLRHSEEISWNLLFTLLFITDSEEVK